MSLPLALSLLSPVTYHVLPGGRDRSDHRLLGSNPAPPSRLGSHVTSCLGLPLTSGLSLRRKVCGAGRALCEAVQRPACPCGVAAGESGYEAHARRWAARAPWPLQEKERHSPRFALSCALWAQPWRPRRPECGPAAARSALGLGLRGGPLTRASPSRAALPAQSLPSRSSRPKLDTPVASRLQRCLILARACGGPASNSVSSEATCCSPPLGPGYVQPGGGVQGWWSWPGPQGQLCPGGRLSLRGCPPSRDAGAAASVS